MGAKELDQVWANMARAAKRFDGAEREAPKLIAVSKTYGPEDIAPILEAGQRDFGENRVQEAQSKWPDLRAQYPDLVLHLIGPLQTNKAKDAVELFDVIHSLDREKLARHLKKEMEAQGKNIPLFIQVNIGEEEQKSGIAPNQTADFVRYCQNDLGLDILGLMAIPPVGEPPAPFFARLVELGKSVGLEKYSMGMSADYETAIEMGASYVRVGSAIFGARDYH
jgi:pyridoxal phosphate enzyme (YggS family)